MNQEYWKEIEQSLALLNKSTGQTWEYETTGGNCDCFQLNLPQGYYMVTLDASAPLIGEWENITLGWYTEDNYEGVFPDGISNLETLSAYLFGHDMARKDICPICGTHSGTWDENGCTCWLCGSCNTTNPNHRMVCSCGRARGGVTPDGFSQELENAGRALRDARRTYLALLDEAKKRQIKESGK